MGGSRNPGHAALRRGRVSLAGQVYHVTAGTPGRIRRFGDFPVACAVARSFHGLRLPGDARMLAWVLMPDHAHWLIELGNRPLAVVVNRIKSASARAVNEITRCDGAVWVHAYHDRALRRDDDILIVARYIIANPIRAGLVRRAGDYPFWNAIWLA
jgi:REP element-mobilizing transposase RayT